MFSCGGHSVPGLPAEPAGCRACFGFAFPLFPLSFFFYELQPCSGRAALPLPGEQPRRARPERRLTWHRGAAAAQVCTPERREELLGRVRHHLTALKRMTCGKHICARVEKLLETTHKQQLNAAVRRPTIIPTLTPTLPPSYPFWGSANPTLYMAPPSWLFHPLGLESQRAPMRMARLAAGQ